MQIQIQQIQIQMQKIQIHMQMQMYHATVHHTTLHYTTLRYATLRYTIGHYTTLHYSTLLYATVHDTTLHYINYSRTLITVELQLPLLPQLQQRLQLHHIKLHYTTLRQLHCSTLQLQMGMRRPLRYITQH